MLGCGFNRILLLDFYNYFKNSSKARISMYYICSSMFPQFASYEQYPTIYQNLGTHSSTNQDLLLNNHYALSWNTHQNYSACDANLVTMASTFREEPQEHPQVISKLTSKPKRRMEKTLEKEILSAKKNSESNIINQFYSFFGSREKSERIVARCCNLMEKSNEQIEKILPIFYTTIRFINAKRGRKYVNVSLFLKFFTAQQFGEYLSQMKEKIQQLDFLSVQQLCQIFRRCAKYFLRQVSIHAILTSKRISIISKEEHLKKRRKILRTIVGN